MGALRAATMGLLVLCGCDQVFGLESRAAPDAANACPTSYDQTAASTTSKYRAVNTLIGWSGAAALCASDLPLSTGPLYTHLVVITSDAEAADVQALHPQNAAWAGLTSRQAVAVFKWVTNEPTAYPSTIVGTPPWAPTNPNNPDPGCAEMNFDGWHDRNCIREATIVCECDEYANDPTRY